MQSNGWFFSPKIVPLFIAEVIQFAVETHANYTGNHRILYHDWIFNMWRVSADQVIVFLAGLKNKKRKQIDKYLLHL